MFLSDAFVLVRDVIPPDCKRLEDFARKIYYAIARPRTDTYPLSAVNERARFDSVNTRATPKQRADEVV